jgi:hypothetical protein
LLQEYEGLPKTPHHGKTGTVRHPDILPEWIVHIIREPYEQWEEVTSDGETRTIFAGRVPQFGQWIRVVFVGDASTGALHTAYADRRLEKKYGGRPWVNR